MSTELLVLVNIAGDGKKPQALPLPLRDKEEKEEEQGERAPISNPKDKKKPEEDK